MSVNMIDEIRQRTYRYYYEDGLVEIAVGLQFFIIGAVLWVVKDWLEGAAYALVMSAGLFLLIWSGAWGVKWFVTRLKDRITYPRTGKVRYSAQPSRGRWAFVVIIAAVVLINFFIPMDMIQMPTMIGTILAVMLLFMGHRVGLLRMQIAAVVPIVAGALVMWQQWDEVRGVGFVFLSAGLGLVLIGAWMLRSYLAANPAEDAENS